VVLHVLGEDQRDGRRRPDEHRRAALWTDERLVPEQDQVADEPLPRSFAVGEHHWMGAPSGDSGVSSSGIAS
jgi:hypothetical protein